MKIAFITGGTGKLGSRIALHLARTGYEVAISYNQSFEKVKQLENAFLNENRSLNYYKCDLSEPSNINALIKEFKKQFSKLDVLINCAGIFSKNEFSTTPFDDYEKIMNINLKSIFFISQKFSEMMTENSVIINFSSVGGIIPWKNRSLYHISKSGIIALTKSLALELAPKTRVVSIAPGYIDTETNDFNNEVMPLSKIPLKKYGNINNILLSVDFLINNDFITGITIPVDGGRFLT